MTTIWGAAKLTFHFCDEIYAPYFKVCIALTNCHIGILLLRKEDGIINKNYYKRTLDEYWQAEVKQKANVQAQYETKQARKKLVNDLLDGNKETYKIASPVDNNTSNSDCEYWFVQFPLFQQKYNYQGVIWSVV